MENGNIIPFSRGADFYYARANNSYLKNNMDEAIFYLKRATQIEPDNLINLFNLASMLSEVEKFEDSNKILKKIIKEDKENNMPECWYYLAYNYGQTDKYKKVKSCLDKYLKLAPEGEYASQSEEILSNIRNFQYEFEAKDQKELQKVERVCAEGVELVEKNKFNEAIEVFEKAIALNSKFIAPRNNIALCYFYKGDVDRAIQSTEDVLNLDPENIYALCNLATFYHEDGNEIGLKNILNRLSMLDPMHTDEELKLGLTYGSLGKHNWAYAMFSAIIEEEPRNFQIVYFSAVAAFNMKKYKLASKHFKRLHELEPQNPYTELYQNYIEDIFAGQSSFEPISYEIKLPYKSVMDIIKKLSSSVENVGELMNDKKLIEGLNWALTKEASMTKVVVDLILSMDNSALHRLLIDFVYNVQVKYEDRNYAFCEMVDNSISFADKANWPKKIKAQVFTSKQQEVLEVTLHYLQKEFSLAQVYAAQTLWSEYVKENRPIIKKVELWAASLIILVVAETSKNVKQNKEDVLEYFSANPKGVSTKIKELKKGLKVF
ncbi:tetratricopeptide repeat protein [Proteinivorax hydrogeniformans]|uniref:Tetratricopeptide repeat protein n=1 Tax=Proteinivorax hydrogeniformans TaxID=1826727 RepID=A0AAU8HWF0_9FIRM